MLHNNAPSGRAPRWLLPTALLLTLSLPGCLVNRVVEVKEQFCDFDSNFQLVFAETASLQMDNPVLLASDILWLADAEPTRSHETEGGWLMRFVVEEDVAVPEPSREWGFNLLFDRGDDAYRLSRIELDARFNRFVNSANLDPASLAESAQTVCDTGLSFASTTVEMELDEQHRQVLPSRRELIELAGEPHERIDGKTGWVYRYRLKGATRSGPAAQFTVWFDGEDERPVKMETRYARYLGEANFASNTLRLSIDL
jgi:hypothetical protein